MPDLGCSPALLELQLLSDNPPHVVHNQHHSPCTYYSILPQLPFKHLLFKMKTLELFYFGDQSVEPFESLLQLFAECQNSATLDEFLRSSFVRLRAHIAQLHPIEQELFRADTFEALARSIQNAKVCHPATMTVLICVAQLGWAILFVNAISHLTISVAYIYVDIGKDIPQNGRLTWIV
jgi:hypothetical protein